MPSVPTAFSFDDGQPGFSAELAAAAVANLDGTFGTPVRFPINGVTADLKTISDLGEADSSIDAIAAQLISAELSFKTVGITRAVFTIITGVTTADSTGPTRHVTNYANDRMPYFALFLEVLAAEAAGDELVFFPKCKIKDGFGFQWEYGKLNKPQIKCMAIKDSVLGYTMRLVDRAVVAALVLPPV